MRYTKQGNGNFIFFILLLDLFDHRLLLITCTVQVVLIYLIYLKHYQISNSIRYYVQWTLVLISLTNFNCPMDSVHRTVINKMISNSKFLYMCSNRSNNTIILYQKQLQYLYSIIWLAAPIRSRAVDDLSEKI